MKQQIFCTKKHLMVILGLPLGRMGGRADGFFRFYEFFFFRRILSCVFSVLMA